MGVWQEWRRGDRGFGTVDVSAIVIQRNVFMDARYFEDWKVGDRIETLGRTVGDAEISQFVALGGFFEELFMNSEYVAQQSLYPKRFAPGALIFSFTEGLIIMSGCIHGVGLALVSVDEMTFKRPLFAGDTMKVLVEVSTLVRLAVATGAS